MRAFHGLRMGAVAVLALSTACAMRITGTVRDGTSGQPIGGAVLTANDGRDRLSTTDPYGQYAVKTDWKPSNLIVSAPGYETTTVAVPDDHKHPIVDVELQRAFPAAGGAPLVERHAPSGTPLVPAVTGSADTATKLHELQQLYDRGLISDSEYKRTRARIVDGL